MTEGLFKVREMYYKVKPGSKMNLFTECQRQTQPWRRANMKASVNETVLSPVIQTVVRAQGNGMRSWRLEDRPHPQNPNLNKRRAKKRRLGSLRFSAA